MDRLCRADLCMYHRILSVDVALVCPIDLELGLDGGGYASVYICSLQIPLLSHTFGRPNVFYALTADRPLSACF